MILAYLLQNASNMNSAEIEDVKSLSNLYFSKMQEFLNVTLPGLLISDTVTTLVWLLTSKNPDMLVRALVSSNSLYARLPKNLMGLQMPKSNNTLSIFEQMLNSTSKMGYEKSADRIIKIQQSIFAKLNKTSGVNFINVLRAPFSYEILVLKITKLKCLLCNFLVQKYWRKSCL